MKGELVGIFIFKIKSSKCNQIFLNHSFAKSKFQRSFLNLIRKWTKDLLFELSTLLHSWWRLCCAQQQNSKTAKSSRKHTNNPAGPQHWTVIRLNMKGKFSDIKRLDCRFENNFRADLIHYSGRHSLTSAGSPRRHFAGSAGPLDTYPTFTPDPTNRLLRITS